MRVILGILVIAVVLIAAVWLFNPGSEGDAGQPSPHAIDQSD